MYLRCALLTAVSLASVSLIGAGPATAQPSGPPPNEPTTVRRFVRPPNPVTLRGPVRAGRYMEASGRQAAFLGREDGAFEAWVYPLKVLHDFSLSFGTAAYASPIPGASLASSVDIRPEASTVRYTHGAFTVEATWFVPLRANGGIVLLDVHTSEPITVVVQFRVDLKPMWPAALGGQYSYWDDTLKAYVAGEASRKHAALVGSPFSLAPPEQPAHNLPDAPSQFTLSITPEAARRGLIPIIIAASTTSLDDATQTYQHLLAQVPEQYGEACAHYRRLREEFTSIDTPDDRLDLALEWGKVALDKGFVCNPHLGCGLIAGLGPSGTSERPGFGWFFGGDTFINAWAMTAYGDTDTVRASLAFLAKRQRADGKMMHELSQGAGYLRWFEDFPYGYYHGDTTPLYVVAVRDYVLASGDTAFARELWPSVKRAYEYCVSADEDGDGLMDNTKAGLAAVETGALRRRDVLTDVFLAAAWTDAAQATADLATVVGDPLADLARTAASKARTSLNRRFLDDEHRRIYFAVMKDGRGQAEHTVWPAFGLWRGVFDVGRPAAEGMLDELAGAGVGADWGARMLSIDSTLYEPLSYNNGASWPFLTGFASLALYRNGRPDAAWQYLDGLADLTFLESRGYMAELFSGDRARSVDAAVPHQLFATTGLVSTVLRGLVGLRFAAASTEADGTRRPDRLVLAPRLPAGWPSLRVKNLRWRGITADLEVQRSAAGYSVTIVPRGGRLPVEYRAWMGPRPANRALAPGKGWRIEPPVRAGRGVEVWRIDEVSETTTLTVSGDPGFELTSQAPPVELGDRSTRLRIIDAWVEGHVYHVTVEGRAGASYSAELYLPAKVTSVTGAALASPLPGRASAGPVHLLRVDIPAASTAATTPRSREWHTVTLAVTFVAPSR